MVTVADDVALMGLLMTGVVCILGTLKSGMCYGICRALCFINTILLFMCWYFREPMFFILFIALIVIANGEVLAGRYIIRTWMDRIRGW